MSRYSHSSFAECVPHGAGVDVEVLADPRQSPALLVQLLGFVEPMGEQVLASRSARPLDVFHDGHAVDVKLGRKDVDQLALGVEVDKSFDVVRGQTTVDLARRSGSSSGWAVTLLTSEDSVVARPRCRGWSNGPSPPLLRCRETSWTDLSGHAGR